MTLSAVVSIDMFACRVVEGILWVWMGGEKSEVGPSMQCDGLDDIIPATGRLKNYFINDFQIDLPYDHSYLSENLLDPAHIPISHDATEGGGKRENAQPYKMIVDKDSLGSTGFTGRFRTATARDMMVHLRKCRAFLLELFIIVIHEVKMAFILTQPFIVCH